MSKVLDGDEVLRKFCATFFLGEGCVLDIAKLLRVFAFFLSFRSGLGKIFSTEHCSVAVRYPSYSREVPGSKPGASTFFN